MVVSVTWDATSLGTADGSAVEVRVVGHASGDRSVEVGAVEWVATGEALAGPDLYFLRARYYDPATGRFISRDSLGFAQRYGYAGANPVLLVDPLGLCGWADPWNCRDEVVDVVSGVADGALDCVTGDFLASGACRQGAAIVTGVATGIALGPAAGYGASGATSAALDGAQCLRTRGADTSACAGAAVSLAAAPALRGASAAIKPWAYGSTTWRQAVKYGGTALGAASEYAVGQTHRFLATRFGAEVVVDAFVVGAGLVNPKE